jgi:hypothetical protein
MNIQNRNTDRVSLAFHVLTIAMLGIFALGAMLQVAVQFA